MEARVTRYGRTLAGVGGSYWVIGVDRNNTDETEEVIARHLAEVPGEVLVVDFDGMGPTWTKVVALNPN